jgi:hypothetical protein
MRTLMGVLMVGFLISACMGHAETEQAGASRTTQSDFLSGGVMEFGGGMLMSFVDGSSLLDIEPVFGYFVTREFEVEGAFGFMHMGSDGSSYDITTILGKGILNVGTGTVAVPYGFFGLGFVNHSVDREGGALMRLGGGTRLFVTNTWNIRAELQFEKIYIEHMDDISTNLMLYLTGLVIP